eukprot:3882062-Rhodomonas_salina.1
MRLDVSVVIFAPEALGSRPRRRAVGVETFSCEPFPPPSRPPQDLAARESVRPCPRAQPLPSGTVLLHHSLSTPPLRSLHPTSPPGRPISLWPGRHRPQAPPGTSSTQCACPVWPSTFPSACPEGRCSLFRDAPPSCIGCTSGRSALKPGTRGPVNEIPNVAVVSLSRVVQRQLVPTGALGREGRARGTRWRLLTGPLRCLRRVINRVVRHERRHCFLASVLGLPPDRSRLLARTPRFGARCTPPPNRDHVQTELVVPLGVRRREPVPQRPEGRPNGFRARPQKMQPDDQVSVIDAQLVLCHLKVSCQVVLVELSQHPHLRYQRALRLEQLIRLIVVHVTTVTPRPLM